jgi:SAM-dependent methyltransferase
VAGVDLSGEYVETGTVLNSWVGLADRVRLERKDASAGPFPKAAFDKAFMLHVGMNIADKQALASAMRSALKPGGRLGVYDVMRVGEGGLDLPVPWATTAEESFVARPEDYVRALEAAGFRVLAKRDRAGFAIEFFADLRDSAASGGGPPPLGIHILMGESAPEKVANMIENVSEGRVAPVELIAERAE